MSSTSRPPAPGGGAPEAPGEPAPDHPGTAGSSTSPGTQEPAGASGPGDAPGAGSGGQAADRGLDAAGDGISQSADLTNDALGYMLTKVDFQSFPRAPNAIHAPSGENIGHCAPSLPGTTLTSAESSERR